MLKRWQNNNLGETLEDINLLDDSLIEEKTWENLYNDFRNCEVGIAVEEETEDNYSNSDFFWYDSPPDNWQDYGEKERLSFR